LHDQRAAFAGIVGCGAQDVTPISFEELDIPSDWNTVADRLAQEMKKGFQGTKN
jgi:lipoate-protein ligase B